jgi:hypothetical protein
MARRIFSRTIKRIDIGLVMFYTVVIDPEILSPNACKNRDYTNQAIQFFMDLQINGFIIVDDSNKIMTELDNAMYLLKGRGDRIRIAYEELLKARRPSIFRQLKIEANDNNGIQEICIQIWLKGEPDDMITTEEQCKDLRNKFCRNNLISLLNYIGSDLQKKGRDFLKTSPLDDMGTEEIRNIISRVTKYSSSLRIYDPHIGEGNNTEDYCDGIKFIINAWLGTGDISQSRKTLEIFTCERNNNKNDKIIKMFGKMYKDDTIANANLDIYLIFVRGKKSEFHSRHLEADGAIVLFDRGFNLFKRNNRFWRNIIKIDMGAKAHLSELREANGSDNDGRFKIPRESF